VYGSAYQRLMLCGGLLLAIIVQLTACTQAEDHTAQEWVDIAFESLHNSALQYDGQWEGRRGNERIYPRETVHSASSEAAWQPVVPPEAVPSMMEDFHFDTRQSSSEYAVIDMKMEQSKYTNAMQARMLEQFDVLANQAGTRMKGQLPDSADERSLLEALWKHVEVDAVYKMWIHRQSGVPEQVEVNASLHYTIDGNNMQETIACRYVLISNDESPRPETAL